MNNIKLRKFYSFFSPSRTKVALFIRITLFLAFFGTVCYLVAGWDLLRAITAALITAFFFMLLGDGVLKIIVIVMLIIQRRRP